MNKDNDILLGLLKHAKTEISDCCSRHIVLIDEYEKRKSKYDTLAAAKASPSSNLDGLKDIVAATDGKAPSQAATFQLQELADSVDRALENWINEWIKNSGAQSPPTKSQTYEDSI